jgi:agmatinase
MQFGLLVSVIVSTYAREIVFPPVVGRHDMAFYKQEKLEPQRLWADHDDVPLETDAVGGLGSFAHLPYVPCFSPAADDDIMQYDIAVLGAPFDTGTSYRPGARFGPHGIRDGSRRLTGYFSWNVYTGQNPFSNGAKIVDCGNAPLTFFDNTVAMKQLGKAHKVRLPS